MNPLTRTRLMLHSHHKAHRLEADIARMHDVMTLIAEIAHGGSGPATDAERLSLIARLARSGLAGATPAHPEFAAPDRQAARGEVSGVE
jgi:hypothetical protein